IAQKWGNCHKNWMANKTHAPVQLIGASPKAATQPIKQGKAPGTAPTSTEIEFTFLSGVYMKPYKKRLNKLTNALVVLKKYHIINTPAAPAKKAKTPAS